MINEEKEKVNVKEKQTKNWMKEIREWFFALAFAVAISMLFQTYVYAQSEVHNVSMQNTLVAGQRLIEDKWSYRFHEPQRGDIVIIKGPESDVRLIKRVIGVPGDLVEFQEGDVFLNGEKLEENYVKGRTYPGITENPFTVQEGQLYVMGDNRENSLDSRDLGPIARTSIEGRAVFRIWPLPQFGSLSE